MKLKIISDDGAIQGWFVAFLITFLRLAIYVLNYFIPSFSDIEIKVGSSFTTFSLMSVGSWFAYKSFKLITQGGETKVNL